MMHTMPVPDIVQSIGFFVDRVQIDANPARQHFNISPSTGAGPNVFAHV